MDQNTREVIFSSRHEDWETPREFFELCRQIFDIRYDAAADVVNSKCPLFLSAREDSLNGPPWMSLLTGKYSEVEKATFWLNPPYGRGIRRWVDRVVREVTQEDVSVVVLLPARTDTRWFKKLAAISDVVYFLEGRLKFSYGDGPNAGKNSAPFPSALFYASADGVGRDLIDDGLLRDRCTLVVDRMCEAREIRIAS